MKRTFETLNDSNILYVFVMNWNYVKQIWFLASFILLNVFDVHLARERDELIHTALIDIIWSPILKLRPWSFTERYLLPVFVIDHKCDLYCHKQPQGPFGNQSLIKNIHMSDLLAHKLCRTKLNAKFYDVVLDNTCFT